MEKNKIVQENTNEFEVCGHVIKFRLLTVKEEIEIYNKLKDYGFSLGSIGIPRITNVFILAKSIESVDNKSFNKDFDKAVSWIGDLDNIVFDYMVKAWSRFSENEISRIEKEFANEEILNWPLIEISPRDIGKSKDVFERQQSVTTEE